LHARAVLASHRASVAWIADPVRERGEALASECAARYADDIASALADVDAVSICVPHFVLAETAITAAHAGVHILLEKPMATTLTDATSVIEATRTAGRVLMIGFVHRFRPEAQRAHALIAAGAIGEPRLLVDQCVGGNQTAWPAWAKKTSSGGGQLLYAGVHRFDRARWLLGCDVRAVRGEIPALVLDSEVDTSYTALLTLEESARAVLSFCLHAIKVPFAWETVVHGTHGMVRLRAGEGIEVIDSQRSWYEASGPERHFDAEIETFLDAIAGHASAAIPSGHDGWAALEVALAIARSHSTGATISLAKS
jgi:predicted dehydrogenase